MTIPSSTTPWPAPLWPPLRTASGRPVGYRFADVRADDVPGVLAAYPRLGFKAAFGALFTDQATRKPGCRVAAMVADGKLAAIDRAPFEG